MATKAQYSTHSPLDDITDEAIDAMIAQNGPMTPTEIGNFVGLTNTRIKQILDGAQAKAMRVLDRRGITTRNFHDILPDGNLDTSYWRTR